MISARFRFHTKEIGFSIRGHAGSAPYGEDIVCAGVSAVAQAIAFGLRDIAAASGKLEVEDGRLSWYGPPAHDAALLVKTLHYALADIAKTYPKAIRVEEEDE